MRIFASVFGGLLLVALVAFGGWYGWQRYVLAQAVHQLETSVTSLKRTATANAGSGCQKALALRGYQLRFTSATEYVIESVCADGANTVVEQKQLQGGAERLYGSGIFVGMVENQPQWGDAWVHLKYRDRIVAVGLSGGLVMTDWQAEKRQIGGDSPAIAACKEWGFSCCAAKVESGLGVRVQTSDCMDSCYQTCNQSPLVLFFNTDPVINPKTRTVELVGKQPTAHFGFEVTDSDDGIERAMIDFGDGKKSAYLRAKETDLTHVYSCARQTCTFITQLMAWDKRGNVLPDTASSQIQVVVRP